MDFVDFLVEAIFAAIEFLDYVTTPARPREPEVQLKRAISPLP